MIVALTIAFAATSTPAVAVHHKIVQLEPVWIAQPTREDIDREYPDLAKQWRDNGRAVVECTAQDDGTLSACSIVSETPEGEGFGAATLRLTSRYRLAPTDAKGRPIKGFRAQLTVAWGVLP
ncbi:MAG TPA: energy transducer TonB [Caulobacteraceae bacterium]|jgi:protein TonB